uniref:Cohesin subunit SA n=1 Tax=Anolis carolinensis TaxID=28377 RepID=A0A803T4Q9_ANOCA
ICEGNRSRKPIRSVVDDWVEAYKRDRDVALLDLINFFIQCSGCQGMVTAEMFQSVQNCEVMQKMTETFDEDNEDYPLIKPGPYWKKFRANFCEFIAVLVEQCQYIILYDSYLMDTIISLLTGLADSMVRAFRHTSTLAAMKLLTALVNLHLNLDISKHNLERLYEVEKNRAAGKRTNSRLDQLEKKKKEFEQKYLEMDNMMNAIFKGTFLQRYRDIIPEIRAICIEEMGSWMKMYPDTFLNDSYLKYIGWMLYDKQPEVRLKCLQGLQGIYGQKDLVYKMDLFTSRFKDRIVSMSLDKEHEVAVQAMKLLMLMNCEDALSSEDYETLYQFVYTTHRPLATAAGELFYNRLLIQESEMDSFANRNGKWEPVASQLRTLIIFFLESELHSHVTYLVDSLWDWALSVLKDWECMTALLLENTNDHDEALSKAEESALIEIILATIREAAEGHPPAGRAGTRKVLSAKEKKIQVEDCTKITEHFIVVLPQLLAKYSTDAEKVTNLLQIPQYFDLELYSTGPLDKHLDTLLKEVEAIVAKHSDTDVLETCSRVYHVLGSEGLAICNKVVAAKTELVDELVNKLNHCLIILWKLFVHIYLIGSYFISFWTCSAHDLSKWNLYDKMIKLLVFELEHGSLPLQVTLVILLCRNFSSLSECMMHISCLLLQGFAILCDLLMIVSHQDSSDDETVESLDYLPSSSLQTKMIIFIQDHVFTDEEEETKEEDRKKESQKLDALHLKRCLLAAYCKLIIYNVVEMTSAAEIYKHYMKTYNDFGDIIKETLSRSRHNDKIRSAKTVILCLQQLFQKYVESQDDSASSITSMDVFSVSFVNIKELARRFSLTFGWDQVKSRESVAMIHKEGIEFAFQGAATTEEKSLPPNLNFLVILSEFSNKLLKPDKRLVYSYLQRYIPEPALCKGDSWYSLGWYRTSLLANEEEENSVVSSLNEWPPLNLTSTLA